MCLEHGGVVWDAPEGMWLLSDRPHLCGGFKLRLQCKLIKARGQVSEYSASVSSPSKQTSVLLSCLCEGFLQRCWCPFLRMTPTQTAWNFRYARRLVAFARLYANGGTRRWTRDSITFQRVTVLLLNDPRCISLPDLYLIFIFFCLLQPLCHVHVVHNVNTLQTF